jgi:hypothetical protein
MSTTITIINDGQPFIGAQAESVGLTRAVLWTLIKDHRVRRVLRGVYVDSSAPDSRALRVAALHLVKPRDAVFYGTTVAFLLGVDAFPPKDRFNLVPQCVVPHHTVRRTGAHVRCREGYLPAEDLEVVDGLVITNPVRTTVDLLRTLWRPHALAAADAMAHAGLVSREEVDARIRPLKGYPGIVQARTLARLIEPLAESAGESWQRLRLFDAGFPIPQCQVKVYDRSGEIIARLDNAYEKVKVGIEYDGREFHDDDMDKEDDNRKRGYLRDVLGWRLAIGRQARIFGDDPTFEQQIGEWIGLVPLLPRRW